MRIEVRMFKTERSTTYERCVMIERNDETIEVQQLTDLMSAAMNAVKEDGETQHYFVRGLTGATLTEPISMGAQAVHCTSELEQPMTDEEAVAGFKLDEELQALTQYRAAMERCPHIVKRIDEMIEQIRKEIAELACEKIPISL